MAAAFGQVTAAQWLAALAATAVSFWAVGHCDLVLHRHLGTGVGAGAAKRSGSAAITISQTLGFGLITGALVRWRMRPGMTLWQAARLTATVAISFLIGWALVTALALLIFPLAGAPGLRLVAATVLGTGAGGGALGAGGAAPPRTRAGFRLAKPRDHAADSGLRGA